MASSNFLIFLKKEKVFFLFICIVFMSGSCTQKNNIGNTETNITKNKIAIAAKDTSTINNSPGKTKLSCCKSPSRMRALTTARK